MNQLMQFGNTEKTMSSLEIAELVESRHDKVKQSIERLASRAVIELPPMGEIKTVTKPVQVYIFSGEKGKRDSYVVVAQICPEFTARLVDRWQELESQQQGFQIPQTKSEALRLAADLAEQVEQQQALIEHQKPAVEFVGRYVESTSGSMSFRQTAKALGIKENVFRAFLSQNRIMYPQGTNWLPYACHIDAGRFEVKTGSSNGHAFTQSRFTAKGFRWIAGLLTEGVAA